MLKKLLTLLTLTLLTAACSSVPQFSAEKGTLRVPTCFGVTLEFPTSRWERGIIGADEENFCIAFFRSTRSSPNLMVTVMRGKDTFPWGYASPREAMYNHRIPESLDWIASKLEDYSGVDLKPEIMRIDEQEVAVRGIPATMAVVTAKWRENGKPTHIPFVWFKAREANESHPAIYVLAKAYTFSPNRALAENGIRWFMEGFRSS